MKFVTMRVTQITHKNAKALAARDGVKLWKAVETAIGSARRASDESDRLTKAGIR